MTNNNMRSLVDELNDASSLYYAGEESFLTDAEWDKRYDALKALEAQTGTVLPDSPTHRVGAQAVESFEKHRHISRLWSMDKVQSKDDLRAWFKRTQKTYEQLNDGRAQPLPALRYAVEYKLDGLTVNLTYDGGKLIYAATRGNGVEGDGILPQAKTIRSVPLSIPYQGLMEIQGEGIMRLSVLSSYNKTAADPLKNARNAAAGALMNHDPKVTATRKLDAFFYQIGTISDPPYHDMDGMIDFIRQNRFPMAGFEGRADTPEEAEKLIDQIEGERASLDFLIDGAVVKVLDMETRRLMGSTEKFPRWAVAYKFAAEENSATLLDVTWQLGRTGKLTPLAHLTPTDIGGVTVQRATLNNLGDVRRKDVAIGCKVLIRRSNDVIPEILGRMGEPGQNERPIEAPAVCPACGSPLVTRGAHIFCLNRETCKPQAIERLAHFAGRDAMDIDSFSGKTAELLYDALHVRDCADLYRLTVNELLPLEGFQQKRAENLVAALDKSRHCALDAFLFALGIPNVGRKTARDLANRFGSLDALKAADLETLTAIPDVGDTVAGSIVEFFSFPENLQMIQRLLDAGVTPVYQNDALSDALAGKTVVVTGTLPTLSRDEAEKLVARHGGHAAGSVSKKTSFVLAGEKAGSKLQKAQSLGVPVLDEAAFLAMLGESAPDQTPAGEQTHF